MPITRSIQTVGGSVPSTKTLGQLKALVAAPVGAKDNPDEVRALDAIHMAIDWLMEWEWDWFLLTNQTFDTVAGTAEYTITNVNGGVRTLQNVRVSSGTQRPLVHINETLYNRVVHDQSSNGMAVFYSLNPLGQSQKIRLYPTPDSVETITYDAFTDITKATDSNDTLFIPTWMERALVLQAQGLVSEWRGSPSSRLFALAEDARKGAAARDRAPYDAEIRLIPFDEHASPHASLDVEGSYWGRFD